MKYLCSLFLRSICFYFTGGADEGFAPSFIEKPKIIPNESGTLITMKCKCTAKPKPVVSWFKGTKQVQESSKIKMKMIENEDIFDILLEIQVYIFNFSKRFSHCIN